MNTNQPEKDKASESSGQEIEKTHESYAKGYPAPGTRHAGEEGKMAEELTESEDLDSIDVNEHNRAEKEAGNNA